MTDTALPIATTFIADHEGFRAEPYDDGWGTWTIGYGFTYQADGKPVTAATPAIAQPEAYERLTEMVSRVLVAVRIIAPTKITDNQAAALTSFAYNLGTNALRHSTLLELLNKADVEGAAGQFGVWVHAGGKVSNGLIARRADERALFLTPDSEPAKPAEEITPEPQKTAGLGDDSAPERLTPTDALNEAQLQSLHPTPA